MTVIKTKIGSAFFEYIEHYPNEQDALDSKNGEFKEVKIGKLKMERTKISKKESSNDSKSERTPKVEGQGS